PSERYKFACRRLLTSWARCSKSSDTTLSTNPKKSSPITGLPFCITTLPSASRSYEREAILLSEASVPSGGVEPRNVSRTSTHVDECSCAVRADRGPEKSRDKASTRLPRGPSCRAG